MPRKVITIPAGAEASAPIRVDDVDAFLVFIEDFDGAWAGQYVSIYVSDTEDGEFVQMVNSEGRPMNYPVSNASD